MTLLSTNYKPIAKQILKLFPSILLAISLVCMSIPQMAQAQTQSTQSAPTDSIGTSVPPPEVAPSFLKEIPNISILGQIQDMINKTAQPRLPDVSFTGNLVTTTNTFPFVCPLTGSTTMAEIPIYDTITTVSVSLTCIGMPSYPPSAYLTITPLYINPGAPGDNIDGFDPPTETFELTYEPTVTSAVSFYGEVFWFKSQ